MPCSASLLVWYAARPLPCLTGAPSVALDVSVLCTFVSAKWVRFGGSVRRVPLQAFLVFVNLGDKAQHFIVPMALCKLCTIKGTHAFYPPRPVSGRCGFTPAHGLRSLQTNQLKTASAYAILNRISHGLINEQLLQRSDHRGGGKA